MERLMSLTMYRHVKCNGSVCLSPSLLTYPLYYSSRLQSYRFECWLAYYLYYHHYYIR